MEIFLADTSEHKRLPEHTYSSLRSDLNHKKTTCDFVRNPEV